MIILRKSVVFKSILPNISNGRSQCRWKNGSQRFIFQSLSQTLKLIFRGFRDKKSPEEVEKLLNVPAVKEFLQFIKSECDKCENRNLTTSPVLNTLETLKKCENHIKDLSGLHNDKDPELRELIKYEKENYEKKARQLLYQLLWDSVPKRNYDDCNDIIIQVTAGVGGQEAKLFAEELFNMYLNYVRFMNWSLNYVRKSKSDKRGISKAEAFVSGELAFLLLQNEAGIHRVQRIPVTEKSGRAQTSTCKVIVLPDKTNTEIVLKESDLKYDYTKSSGPGGQNVNKLETKVRLTHLPTGHVVESQECRTLLGNKQSALLKLKQLLFEENFRLIEEELNKLVKKQAATVDRSDKIRTYNFLHNRISDHRLNSSFHNVQVFMQGTNSLHEVVLELNAISDKSYLLNEINKVLKERNIKEILKA